MQEAIFDLSAVGSLILSAIAFFTATSARKAVTKVIKKKDDQEDTEKLKHLISTIRAVIKESLKYRAEAGISPTEGISLEQSKRRMLEAESTLRTSFPLSWDEDQRNEVVSAADKISDVLETIEDEASLGIGWTRISNILQLLVPRLEQEERALINAQLGLEQ